MIDLLVKVLLAYMLGSVSGSMVMGAFRHVDIRESGSGNAGYSLRKQVTDIHRKMKIVVNAGAHLFGVRQFTQMLRPGKDSF